MVRDGGASSSEQMSRDGHGGHEDSKLEAVDLPQRLRFELATGKMSVDLVDDRFDEAQQQRRQLLSLSLHEASWAVDIDMLTDSLGKDAFEWRVEGKLKTFSARHSGRIILHFRQSEVQQMPGDLAGHLVLANTLEPARNLLTLQLSFAPLEVHLPQGMFSQLLKFFERDVEPSQWQGAYDTSQDSLPMSQRVVDKVYEQIPDEVQLDVRISSPVIVVPVENLGSARFSLGDLHLVTLGPCAYERLACKLKLEDISLRSTTARGANFNVVKPLQLCLDVQLRMLDDENHMEVQAAMSQAALSVSPEAMQILTSIPSALSSLLGSFDEAEPSFGLSLPLLTVSPAVAHGVQSSF
ncbi:tipC [Symbiodinium sp. CCMP2456]|nr:tipC [Symbiodinium sp. CCMP2456]